MSKDNIVKVLVSSVLGLIITYFTVLVELPGQCPESDVVGICIRAKGFPLAFYSGAVFWQTDWYIFAVDVLIWSLVVFVILSLSRLYLRKNTLGKG